MAELDDYTAALDQAINTMCDEVGISREFVDACVEADRAAMAPRWEAEKRFAEDVQQRQAQWVSVLEDAVRAAHRDV